MKKRVLAVVLALTLAVGIFGAMTASAADTIKIGYVNPSTGALAGNGEGAQWVIDQITKYVNEDLGGIEVDGAVKPIEVVLYDSESDSAKCSEMAQKLIEENNVDIMIAIQTPETVIPVAATAERYGVPCVSIQAPVNPVAANVAGGVECEYVFHAFWTIENVYECHKALWTAAGYGPGEGYKVGITFATDADGTAWHDIFVEKLPEDGYVVVDPGQYPSGSNDFTSLANTFKAEEIDILAGTNIPPDFLNVYKACLAAGVQVGCITMGKCCLLPGDVSVLENDTQGLAQGIMTEVWWTPNYPFSSATTGISSADLGAAYSADNDGRDMPQPAGYAYASLEIAIDALTRAASTDPDAIRDALAATDLDTIVGPIKYDKELMGLHYGDTVIAGGQWQLQEDGTEKLVVIDNTVYDVISVEGEYVPGNATNK
ncbi:MAG: ABC transporter substrate-binding protein [Parasporobacterium sp.]|nr:ABC transporter substrate-binding protein [Parasporobacterium sp.]